MLKILWKRLEVGGEGVVKGGGSIVHVIVNSEIDFQRLSSSVFAKNLPYSHQAQYISILPKSVAKLATYERLMC